ncbi:serine hydrolase domain-containing protein [Streptomyces sp. NPDC127068]|uniref:serine hydrolase domain-containing protein n=1 Tax=Streptomyces sp. NPDC127068 TaxID=3347127 RepID=UPI003669D56C
MRTAVVGLAVAAVTVTGIGGIAQAEQSGERKDRGHAATQRAIDAVVAAGVPGALGQARDKDGVWKGSSGVGNVKTITPRGANDRFRIGSVTKTFTAAVLLQMEADGLLDLDDTVEKWLPGLVRGNGNDGRKITVRMLLNHTSGLFNYLEDNTFYQKYLVAPGFFQHRYDTHTPEQLVRVGIAHKPYFAPGTQHNYSNTGYILAGMIIEKAGGSSYEQEMTRRIIKPLGLRGTSAPGKATGMPQPSGRGYDPLSLAPNATKLYDTTELSPTIAWSSGDLISTTGDLNRFFSALMRGKLFPREQLNAMKTTVPDPDEPGQGYGLGIRTIATKCGAKVWGHPGGIPGGTSYGLTTEDGRHTFAFNMNAEISKALGIVEEIPSAEFCRSAT